MHVYVNVIVCVLLANNSHHCLLLFLDGRKSYNDRLGTVFILFMEVKINEVTKTCNSLTKNQCGLTILISLVLGSKPKK